MPPGSADTVVVLDFGSQYTQLIARRIRELKVYSEIHPFDFSVDAIRELAPKAIILSAGPESVGEAGSPPQNAEDACKPECFERLRLTNCRSLPEALTFAQNVVAVIQLQIEPEPTVSAKVLVDADPSKGLPAALIPAKFPHRNPPH